MAMSDRGRRGAAKPRHRVTIILGAPVWLGLLPGIQSRARDATRAALDVIGPGAPVEVTVLLADDATLRRLNRDFRGQDKATNVLAFPAAPPSEEPAGGDIAVASETCAREAEEAGKPVGDHLSHLIVHGTLHLLGYDHATEADAQIMEGLERRALAGLGIADPYAAPADERINERAAL